MIRTMKSAWYAIKRQLPQSWVDHYNEIRGRQIEINEKQRANLPIVPRHTAPYTTHLPVLIALAHATKIERVLELGAGLHSTPAFLNPQAFPDLVELVSIENDAQWYDTIKQNIDTDPRIDLRLIEGTVSDFVTNFYISRFDLIFIDDSTSYEARSATIREVSQRCMAHTLVAIHDFQDQPYRDAANEFVHVFYFNHFNPAVGVLWNGELPVYRKLNILNRKINRHNEKQPDNLNFWSETLNLSWLDYIRPF